MSASESLNTSLVVANGFSEFVSNTAPTISDATANQTVNDNATLAPFSSVTLADAEGNALSITIALDIAAKGTLSAATISSGTIANVQATLRDITFNPADNRVAVGETETTTFTLTVNDGTVDSTANNTTTVVSTSINDTPTDIALSNSSVNQSGSANAAVGTLSSTDADFDESFTYSLVSGDGATHNNSFNISSNSLQAKNASALSAGTYSIRVQTNDGGSSGTFAKALSITVVDDVVPTLLTLSPANNATGIAIDTNLVLTLNETAVIGTGNVLIKQTSDNATIETIAITNTGQVSVSGAAVTINPSSSLGFSTGYYVQIDATALKDSAGNAYVGISDTSSWRFTTEAKAEPTKHPTAFTATPNSTSQITTTWTDATGAVLPESYLVQCSTTNSFTDPTDATAQSNDTDCADGSGVQNIAQGTQTVAWTGLNTATQYFFKLFPFSNTGDDVDYKIDGTAETANATTTDYSIAIAKTTDGVESNGGTPTDAVFTVTVTPANASGSAITGDIAYTGTASNGSDYATGATGFSIANNSDTATITLDVTEDAIVEGTESIIATVSNVTAGSLSTRSATANLTDDDNAPVFSSSNTVNLIDGNTAVITTVASDADSGDSVTFSLTGGVDAALFTLTTAGVLSFNTAPSFASPTDTGADNTYNVTVQASDGVQQY